MSKKQMTWSIICALVLLAVVIFFVVSLCLAQQHGVTIVQEWQDWFCIKDVVDDLESESMFYICTTLRI